MTKDMPTTVVAIFFSQYVADFGTDVLSLNGHLRIQSIRSWGCYFLKISVNTTRLLLTITNNILNTVPLKCVLQ